MRAKVAWVLAGVTWAAAVAQVCIAVAADGVALFSRETLSRGFPILTLAAVTGATVGALIVTRQPRNRIGWLLCVGQPGTIVGLVFASYGRYAFEGRIPGSRGAAQQAMWVGHVLGGALAVGLVTILLLLVPDGRLPSRRWRPALAAAVLGIACGILMVVVTPVSLLTPNNDADLPTRTSVFGYASTAMIFVAVLSAAVALPLRLRRAGGEQRQQLRWVAMSGSLIVLAILFQVAVAVSGRNPADVWYADLPIFLAYLTVPVATGFAVLRYRLYDVDVILGRALVLGALLAFVTVGYVSVVVLLGAFVGQHVGATFWASLLATALVALAFQPLRRRVGRWADRVAYGERAAPYEALGEFTRELESSLSTAELLPRVAEAAARTVNATASVVTLAIPGGDDVRVTWPAAYRDDLPTRTEETRCVMHHGEELGTITVELPRGRTLRAAESRLLDDLAVQAALPFLNARLFAALEQRSRQLVEDAAAVEASRRRLVVAGDAERRRLARSINREVLPYLESPPDRLDALGELSSSVGSALDALRRISKGVFPPVLGRKGVVAALRAALEPGGHALEVEPAVQAMRFDPRVEAAAYFCCVESVRDLHAPASVSVRVEGPDLRLVVEGTRREGAELEGDLQLVGDRIAAVGGQVEVSPDGSSIRVTATIPAASVPAARVPGPGERGAVALAHSAASRSGSNADFAT